MKTFIIRLVAIVVAVVLFIGAVYTCGIAAYMCILSNDVAEAEMRVVDSHTRRSANAVYESVSEARDELYYGGGYKSWFSTLPKALQIIGVLVSLALIAFELFMAYALYSNYKYDKELERRREEQRRYERQMRAREAYWNGTKC